MNELRPSERLSGLLAFVLSGLFYLVLVAILFVAFKNRPMESAAFSPAPVTLSFAQIELQAAVELPQEVKPEPAPPEEEQRPAIEPEPPAPEPEKKVEAQVTQEASAPEVQPVDSNALLSWVREQIEKEKYYPPAARNAGLEGHFRLRVVVDTDGRISDADVLDGEGHPILRRALEKITTDITGRDSGLPLPEPYILIQPFDYELN